jgi:flagellar motor switch protein FliN
MMPQSSSADQPVPATAKRPDLTPDLNSLDHLLDANVTVTAELGRVRRSIGEVLKVGVGAVIELDRLVSEPVDLLVQGVPLARGEVVVVGDHFAVRITELADMKKRPV